MIVHLGKLVDDPDDFNGGRLQLEKGDFYVSVVVFGAGQSSSSTTNDDVVVRCEPSSSSQFRSTVSSSSESERVSLILNYNDGGGGGSLIEFKEITLSPVDFVNLFAYLTTSDGGNNLFDSINIPSTSLSSSSIFCNRFKLGRYLSLKTNGRLDIMPLMDENSSSSSMNICRTFCAQNDEYFNFIKKKTDDDLNNDHGDKSVDVEENVSEKRAVIASK